MACWEEFLCFRKSFLLSHTPFLATFPFLAYQRPVIEVFVDIFVLQFRSKQISNSKNISNKKCLLKFEITRFVLIDFRTIRPDVWELNPHDWLRVVTWLALPQAQIGIYGKFSPLTKLWSSFFRNSFFYSFCFPRKAMQ